MFELVIIAAVAVGVYARMDALNEVAIAKAKAAGREPVLLNMSNPIHWVRAVLNLGAYGVGYTPTAIRRGLEEIKTASAEAKKDLQNAGIEIEASNKVMKKAGQQASAKHHNPRIQALMERRAELNS